MHNKSLLGLLLLVLALPVLGKALEVTDLMGRQVSFANMPTKIVLAEGRMLYMVTALQPEAPLNGIVALASDFRQADPDTWQRMTEQYPKLSGLVKIESPSRGGFNAEQVLSLNADLVIFSQVHFSQLQEARVLANLDLLNIPYLFIDYRSDPATNLLPSIQLLGLVFGKTSKANEFVNFYQTQLARVTDVLARVKPTKPLVLMERAAGLNGLWCCRVFGKTSFGHLLELAGGNNWGSEKTSGMSIDLNPEQLIVGDFDLVIATVGNWRHKAVSIAPPLGYLATTDEVNAGLDKLVNRVGWPLMTAVQQRQVYIIWHQFYNHPAYVVAIQAMAKWMYPELFKDLDPHETFAQYHDKFMPFATQGIFWTRLK